MKKTLSILLFLSFWNSSAQAQSIFKSDMMAYANIMLNQSGTVEACGIEINGLHINQDTLSVIAFSSSISVLAQGYGMVKVVGKRGRVMDNLSVDLQDVPIYGAWMRTPGKPAAIPISDLMDGESPAAKLYISDFEPAADVLAAIAQGRELQVAVSYTAGYQSIFSAIPVMEKTEMEQFSSCINDLEKTVFAPTN